MSASFLLVRVNEIKTPIDIYIHAFGSFGFNLSTSLRIDRSSVIQVAVRPPGLISSSTPFNHNRSCSNEASARDVVLLRK
jgi:hypothetical protein